MPVLRFQDGQMISSEYITGLIKRESYPDQKLLVSVIFSGGSVDMACKDSVEQDAILLKLGKQLEPYLSPLDLESEFVQIIN